MLGLFIGKQAGVFGYGPEAFSTVERLSQPSVVAALGAEKRERMHIEYLRIDRDEE
jgi:hypothetical protein